uniref:Acylhomoserine lactone dependent transcriptional activator n=1 Tax=uncultured proteobacterium QS1 TaxID=288647 RepID=Q6B346_9PROT|nr:acylhomoserine lactone dependent transcriptional activator [uncultured proteobacterium QS1]
MLELAPSLENALSCLGEFNYSYYVVRKSKNTKPIIVSNYPDDWLMLYEARSYHLYDPVINYGMRRFAPFSWCDAQASDTADIGKELFQSAEKYQISSGFTFVLHDAAELFASLSVCRSGRGSDFGQRVADHSAEIQMALINFHDHILSTQTVDELFPLPANLLSAREIEILQWVGKGKAYFEVAIICAISEHTVKFHISKISTKLNVLNAKQAVYEAIRRGII